MNKSALVFFPEIFVGFNKTQLIERKLLMAGVIANRFRASSAFTAGPAYRQLVPKKESLHKYHYSIIRIYIQSIGQWFSTKQGVLVDRGNLVIVEGDHSVTDLSQSIGLCHFLGGVTGDNYKAEYIDDLASMGIKEPDANFVTMVTDTN